MTSIQPIWKDYYVTFLTEDSPVNYSIRINGEPIFYGKAWCPPSTSTQTYTTKINTICENYLKNELKGFENITTGSRGIIHTDAIKKFEIINDDTLQTIDEVFFVYDWSYDNTVRYNGVSALMNRPINDKGKDGMFFFQTNCQNNSVYTLVSRTPLLNYYLTDDCKSKWALYYLNRYGGWDAFLIEGYVSRTDSYQRKILKNDYDNNTLEFGDRIYMTDISESYEINTGWLNEKESEILAFNLLPSTTAYLHDLEKDKLIPVNINDAEVMYKNRNNTGRKLLSYTINVTNAQKKHNMN